MRRPLLAAVVLPLVVIVGFQSAWAAFACRLDGKVRDHCCCKAEKREKQEPVDSTPRIVARDCCDVSFYEHLDTPPAREADRAAFDHVSVVVPTMSVAIVPPRIEKARSIDALARPPPPRIALFLDKHAILR